MCDFVRHLHDIVLLCRALGDIDDGFRRSLRRICRLCRARRQCLGGCKHLFGRLHCVFDHFAQRREHRTRAVLQHANLVDAFARGKLVREISLGDEAHRLRQNLDGRNHAREEVIRDAAEKCKRREADAKDRIRHARRRCKCFRERHLDDNVPTRRPDRLRTEELLDALEFRFEGLRFI